MSAPFRLTDVPDFSAPAPGFRKVADIIDPIEPTHLVVLRDDKNGVRFTEETVTGRTFAALCRDLADGQIITGCSLSAVYVVDVAAGTVSDVTATVLSETARLCAALNRSSSRTLDAAFDRYGIAPVLDPEDAEDPRAPVHRADLARGLLQAAE